MQNRIATRVVMVALAVLMFSVPARAQTEGAVVFGSSDSYYMGQAGPLATGIVSGRVAADLWDISGWAQLSDSRKIGTPGGYQVSFGGGARHWLGRHLFVAADASRSYTTVHVWTKTVWFAQGTAGACLRYPFRKGGRLHRDELGFTYQREIASDAVDPNRLRGWQFFWRHDVPLRGRWFLRAELNTAEYRFLQSGDWWRGERSNFLVGLVWRPKDL
jgi:hypothetical protein